MRKPVRGDHRFCSNFTFDKNSTTPGGERMKWSLDFLVLLHHGKRTQKESLVFSTSQLNNVLSFVLKTKERTKEKFKERRGPCQRTGHHRSKGQHGAVWFFPSLRSAQAIASEKSEGACFCAINQHSSLTLCPARAASLRRSDWAFVWIWSFKKCVLNEQLNKSTAARPHFIRFLSKVKLR